MLLSLLGFAAHASDLEIQVKVPGVEPVWTTVHDVRVGSASHIEFPGNGRTIYHLDAKVEEPSDGYDWRIAFDLGSEEGRGRGRRVHATMVAQPTMRAHTNELARFKTGGNLPLAGSDPAAFVFYGCQIEWIVTATDAK